MQKVNKVDAKGETGEQGKRCSLGSHLSPVSPDSANNGSALCFSVLEISSKSFGGFQFESLPLDLIGLLLHFKHF